jgi:hypothetical protein
MAHVSIQVLRRVILSSLLHQISVRVELLLMEILLVRVLHGLVMEMVSAALPMRVVVRIGVVDLLASMDHVVLQMV